MDRGWREHADGTVETQVTGLRIEPDGTRWATVPDDVADRLRAAPDPMAGEMPCSVEAVLLMGCRP